LVAARLRLALTRWPAWALVGALARLARDACSRDRSECAPAATNRQAPTLRNPQLRAAVGVGKRRIASGSGPITPRRIAVTLWPLEAAGDRALDGRAKALVHAPQLLMRIGAELVAPDNGLRRKFALATGVALHAPRLANRGGDSRGGLRRAEAPPPCCRRDPRPARPSDRAAAGNAITCWRLFLLRAARSVQLPTGSPSPQHMPATAPRRAPVRISNFTMRL